MKRYSTVRQSKKKRKSREPKKTRGKSVCVKDEEYQNLRHAFDSIGPSCTFNTVRARLRYGWNLEEALEVEQKVDGRKSNANSKKLTIDDITLSVSQAAKKYSAPYSTILDRLNRGASSNLSRL